MSELLSSENVDERLASMDGWSVDGSMLVKEFRFPSYLAGIDFVRVLAEEAEAMNHHPDLMVGWRKVSISLSTHSAGGLTALDFELAAKADRCVTK